MAKDDFLTLAKRRFDLAYNAQEKVRELCIADRRFAVVVGEQWAGQFVDNFTNKPKIEVNKIARAIKRITSEYRQNKTTTQFITDDDDVAQSDTVADVATAMLRSNEIDSAAEEAYDNAWFEGVTGGFGAWRLRADYEDELNEDEDRQTVYFEPIYEADQCVYFDPNSKKHDKEDAAYCFVVNQMTREAYKEQYGDDVSEWSTPNLRGQNNGSSWTWATRDIVNVAEYYRVDKRKVTTNVYRTVTGEEIKYTTDELKADPEIVDKLEATNANLIRTESRSQRIVKKSVLSGGKVLEPEQVIAGKYLPVIPFYGQRFFVGGIEHCAGEARYARDAQILQNVMVSNILEIVAYSGQEVPIFTPQEVAGLGIENQWATRATTRPPYLLRNPVELNGVQQIAPMQYLKNPDVPPAIAALHQVASNDLIDILGKNEQPQDTQANVSGKALEIMHGRIDEQTFVYSDNMVKSRKHSARVWLSMTKDIVQNRSTVKTIDDANKIAYKKIAMPKINQETGEQELHNDLVKANLDVTVSMGASTESKRNAVVRQLIGMLQMITDPAQQQIIVASIMMNMQGEGLSDINDYYRRQLVNNGVVKPNEQEAKEIEAAKQQQANQPPAPNDAYLMASAKKAEADAVQSQAKTENIQADTLKTMAELQMNGAQMPFNNS